MNKKFLFTFLIFTLILTAVVKPVRVSALGFDFDPSIAKVSVGETILVKVFIDTEGKEINSLEGALKVNGQVKISSVDTGGSIFDLWPENPQITNNQISFTGGTKGGVYGKDLRLFNLTITPISEGQITFEPVNLVGYLNDGSGTKLAGNSTIFTINAVKQASVDKGSTSVTSDKIPPAPFEVDLGHDSSLFGGKYFISFYATDADSGVNKYEVKEGDSGFETSDNVYVLKDQTLKSKIIVKAIDNAGNERVEKLYPPEEGSSLLLRSLQIILAIVVFYFLYKLFRKIFKK